MMDGQPEKPGPDPTALTTSALLREVSNLKEQFETKLDGEVEILEARLAAIDKATALFESNLTRVPTEVDKSISHLRDLHDVKFDSIQTQLTDLDVLRNEKFAGVDRQFTLLTASIDKSERVTKTGVDAALEAANKQNAAQAETFMVASNKTEANFTKQIDQLRDLIQATTKALDDKITDVKDRLTRIEGAAVGQLGQKAETHTGNTTTISLIGIGLAILSAVIAVSAFIQRMGHP